MLTGPDAAGPEGRRFWPAHDYVLKFNKVRLLRRMLIRDQVDAEDAKADQAAGGL
jgi:hypothetical protein